jgi:hypothetical protein
MRFDTGDSHDTAKFYVSVLENEASSKKWRDLEHECTGAAGRTMNAIADHRIAEASVYRFIGAVAGS